MTYKREHDPGHSWLEVPIKELERLQIQDKISTYSYRNGCMAYLEEDLDLSIFLDAKEARGEPVDIKDSFVEETIIRSFQRFSANC